jgi:hypothetical protein
MGIKYFGTIKYVLFIYLINIVLYFWRCCMCGSWSWYTYGVHLILFSSVTTDKFLCMVHICRHFVLVLLDYWRFARRCNKSLKLASDQPYQAFSINNWRTNRNTIHSLVQLFDSSYEGFSLLSSRPLYPS